MLDVKLWVFRSKINFDTIVALKVYPKPSGNWLNRTLVEHWAKNYGFHLSKLSHENKIRVAAARRSEQASHLPFNEPFV